MGELHALHGMHKWWQHTPARDHKMGGRTAWGCGCRKLVQARTCRRPESSTAHACFASPLPISASAPAATACCSAASASAGFGCNPKSTPAPLPPPLQCGPAAASSTQLRAPNGRLGVRIWPAGGSPQPEGLTAARNQSGSVPLMPSPPAVLPCTGPCPRPWLHPGRPAVPATTRCCLRSCCGMPSAPAAPACAACAPASTSPGAAADASVLLSSGAEASWRPTDSGGACAGRARAELLGTAAAGGAAGVRVRVAGRSPRGPQRSHWQSKPKRSRRSARRLRFSHKPSHRRLETKQYLYICIFN